LGSEEYLVFGLPPSRRISAPLAGQRAPSKFLFAYGPVAILTRSGVTEDVSLSFFV